MHTMSCNFILFYAHRRIIIKCVLKWERLCVVMCKRCHDAIYRWDLLNVSFNLRSELNWWALYGLDIKRIFIHLTLLRREEKGLKRERLIDACQLCAHSRDRRRIVKNSFFINFLFHLWARSSGKLKSE